MPSTTSGPRGEMTDVRTEHVRGALRVDRPRRKHPAHDRIEAAIGHQLRLWLEHTPGPWGRLRGGEQRLRLRRAPETAVRIDLAYHPPRPDSIDAPDSTGEDATPTLAGLILSPSDTHGSIVEMVLLLLDAGVVVWEIDPALRTIRVFRPGAYPVMVNLRQELSGDPYLPGFAVPVARVFE